MLRPLCRLRCCWVVLAIAVAALPSSFLWLFYFVLSNLLFFASDVFGFFMYCTYAPSQTYIACVSSLSLALAVVVGTTDDLAVVHVRSLLASTLAVHFADFVAALQSIATGSRSGFVAVALC